MIGSVLPGATVGVFGGGQLGRMLGFVAKRMGYQVGVFTPDEGGPASQIADWTVTAQYEDLDRIEAFAKRTDVITMEFENVPGASLRHASQYAPVLPDPSVQEIAQHRIREKTFLAKNSFPIAANVSVVTDEELVAGGRFVGFPAVLKTAGFGYDGKGQRYVENAEELKSAWGSLGQSPVVLEAWIKHEMEIAIVIARDSLGRSVGYPPIENRHHNHILDLSLAPALIDKRIKQEAISQALALAEALELVGVMAIEFFLTQSGDLLINEIAPRPHNSGHLTIEATVCSQFEQQLRAVCGLPLGDTTLLQPAVTGNLLGDLWASGEPNWSAAAEIREVSIHLYGKGVARIGRKMGHLTALHYDRNEAERKVIAARNVLVKP